MVKFFGIKKSVSFDSESSETYKYQVLKIMLFLTKIHDFFLSPKKSHPGKSYNICQFRYIASYFLLDINDGNASLTSNSSLRPSYMLLADCIMKKGPPITIYVNALPLPLASKMLKNTNCPKFDFSLLGDEKCINGREL